MTYSIAKAMKLSEYALAPLEIDNEKYSFMESKLEKLLSYAK